MIITKRHLSRRTVLKGMGVTVALPLLDAMAPAAPRWPTRPPRARCGSSPSRWCTAPPAAAPYGPQNNLWSPAATGRSFDLSPTSLAPLEPLRDYITIVSNTDVRMAEAFTTPEIGGDHFRASSVFLTQAHPKQTMGSDLYVGTSFDQIYARQFGQDTAIPSMQLCIETRRPVRRLRVQLLVRLHRRDQLGVAERAAADAARPARGVRHAVRRRRHA